MPKCLRRLDLRRKSLAFNNYVLFQTRICFGHNFLLANDLGNRCLDEKQGLRINFSKPSGQRAKKISPGTRAGLVRLKHLG